MKLRKGIVVFSTLISVGLIYGCASPATPTASSSDNTVNGLSTPKASDQASNSAVPQPSATASSQPTSVPSIPYVTGTPYASATTAPSSMAGTAPSLETTVPSPINEESKTVDNTFNNYGVNPFVSTQTDHLSTFSIDVDTASYTWLRKSILNNILVSKDSVRAEEYINYFDYNYPQPQQNKFSINTDLVKSNIGDKTSKILRVGIQGKKIDNSLRKNANLTFVIDVSGSMAQENRLELVKQSLKLLVSELSSNDKVSIVVFGSTARIVLQPTGIESKNTILTAIDSLQTEGSTNTEAGLLLGYSLAEKNFKSGAINRLILCSDGVANVGETGPTAIMAKIKQASESGINLSTVGFGMGNYNDTLMEQLADKGDGNYAYVDTLKEADRIFVQNLTGTIQTIAKDTKIQIDFNPQVVKEYRLIGYENRDIADNNFRNDKVDAGEVGSNQSVTALYELKLNDNQTSGKIGNVYLRYKDVDQSDSVFEMNKDIALNTLSEFDNTSDSMKLTVAVAEFAEILRNGYWNNQVTLYNVLDLAKQANNNLDKPEKVNEFVDLVNRTINLKGNQQ